MTSEVTPSTALRGLWDEIIEGAEELSTQQWDATVPWCPAWRVADLVSHLGGLQSAYNGDPQPDPPAGWQAPQGASPFDEAMGPMVAARSAWTPAQRMEELRRAADRHVERLGAVDDWSAEAMGPVGPTTQEGLYRVRAFDLWVHLQDLREALGEPVALNDTSAGAAAGFAHVLRLVPWLYGKRARAPEGSTMRVTLGPPLDHDSVLRVVEGRARWDSEADPGDCLVQASPAALTLLTAGRGTPQRWQEAGVLSWRGPRGDEFVERARMF